MRFDFSKSLTACRMWSKLDFLGLKLFFEVLGFAVVCRLNWQGFELVFACFVSLWAKRRSKGSSFVRVGWLSESCFGWDHKMVGPELWLKLLHANAPLESFRGIVYLIFFRAQVVFFGFVNVGTYVSIYGTAYGVFLWLLLLCFISFGWIFLYLFGI